MYEIELKAHVKEVSKVSETLHKIAKFIHSVKKEDSYYTLEKDSKKITARIRKETEFLNGEKKESFFLTYKKKEMKLNNSGKLIEVNDEKELFLSESEPFEVFLKDTGFKTTLKKHKTVLSWHYDGAHLELCTVERLGDFMEIEILTESNDEKTVSQTKEKLLKMLSKCGISEDKIENRYYSQMLGGENV